MAYDWFIQNRDIDWGSLFKQGVGRINHASLIRFHYPHLRIVESNSVDNGRPRRDVRWITDVGELHEYYLDGWKQQHFIRAPEDYRIARRAFQDAVFTLDETAFEASEQGVGEDGITLGQFGAFGQLGFTRTPFQVVQIDLAGLEQFSLDIAGETPELLDPARADERAVSSAFPHRPPGQSRLFQVMGKPQHRNHGPPASITRTWSRFMKKF